LRIAGRASCRHDFAAASVAKVLRIFVSVRLSKTHASKAGLQLQLPPSNVRQGER
jgi:hypothetical protein